MDDLADAMMDVVGRRGKLKLNVQGYSTDVLLEETKNPITVFYVREPAVI